eukprot:Opistho-2@60690
MSEGELLQIEKVRRLDIVEDVYYDIIRQKTASLIASCCASGAASANASDELVEKMRLFGEYIGMAFQIKDDLLDFGYDDIGKPKGIDIKEKKITLPLIYALNTAETKKKRYIINLVKNHNEEPESVQEVIDFVREANGLDYAEGKMLEFQKKAFDLIAEFPENESRSSLEELVKFT